MKKRDPKVELMRIIACAIVIGAHTYLSPIVNERADIGRVFITCLCADGVAVFWFINGFFLFRKTDYGALLLHTAKNILLPLLCVTLFAFYFGDWLMKGEPLISSLSHPLSDYRDLFNGILSWNNVVADLGHLWYLYVYALVMFFFPVLKAFVDYLEKDTNREKIILILSSLFLLINDISGNRFASFSHHTINALIPAAIEIIWGHIIYKYKNYFCNQKYIGISIVGFLGLNMIRLFIQMRNYNVDLSNKTILYWYTLIGILCALCVVIFCLSTGLKTANNTVINKLICKLASYTYTIYLIHPIVKNVIAKHGGMNLLQKIILNDSHGIVREIVYTAIIIIIVFAISLILSIFLKSIYQLLKKCWMHRRLI